MEEAEALSTKLSIMVEGRIKCIGPIQHLKNKYGKGYEIETKVNLPSSEKKCQFANINQEALESNLTREDVNDWLAKNNFQNLTDELFSKGKGSHIYRAFENNGTVSFNVLVEWVMIYVADCKVFSFLTEKFTNVERIESVQNTFRYKVWDGVNGSLQLSNLFETVETNTQKLDILQYSIKQTTLEQIFVGFARNNPYDDE